MKSVEIVLESGPPNWSGFVPDLPGCVATGQTAEETVNRLREAIEIHLESMEEDGEEIPEAFRSEYDLAVTIDAD